MPEKGRKGSWVVSARRSFLDLFTQDVGFGGVPVLYALNAKAVYDLTPRDRIWLVNVAGIDEIRLGLTESSDLDEEIANFDIRYDGWRSATGFNWQRTFGSRGVGLLGISHSQAKVGQQVKDLVSQGVPPPDVLPKRSSRAVPSSTSRTRARARPLSSTISPCTCRCSTPCRPAAASRHSKSTTRWNRPTATTRRIVGGRHRPVLSRHAVPLVSDRRLPAGLEAGGLQGQFHARRALRPLRHPVAGPVQPARGRQRAPCRHTVVELERGLVLSAAGVPLRDGVSPECVARALARQPLRDGPGLVAQHVPGGDGRGVSEDGTPTIRWRAIFPACR